jgi:predicted lipoprotein with Yx(FWY)xxD motif
MRVRALTVTLLFATLLAACGSTKSSSTTAGAGGSGTTAAATATTAAAGMATVSVGTATKVGQVLVDKDGHTLYTFDPENTGKIVCASGCTSLWPPLTVTGGQPVAGPGVSGLATVSRPEGSTQVTFNGHPLYRFANDTAPGQAKGDGFGGGIWHAAKAPGPTSGTPTTASSGGYHY